MKTTKVCALTLGAIDMPNPTEISTVLWSGGPHRRSGPPGVARLPDIRISGMFDDAGFCQPLGHTGESQELIIKVGRRRTTVPVVVTQSTVVKKRRGRSARWQVTMTQVGPGTWAQPQKKTAPKKKPR